MFTFFFFFFVEFSVVVTNFRALADYNSDDERGSRGLNEAQTARFIDRLHSLGFELRPTAV